MCDRLTCDKEQPKEEAETSAPGDDENMSRSTTEMTRSGMHEDVPREEFKAWNKLIRERDQNLKEIRERVDAGRARGR